MTQEEAQRLLKFNHDSLARLVQEYGVFDIGITPSSAIPEEEAAILVNLPKTDSKLHLKFLEELGDLFGAETPLTVTSSRKRYESLLSF